VNSQGSTRTVPSASQGVDHDSIENQNQCINNDADDRQLKQSSNKNVVLEPGLNQQERASSSHYADESRPVHSATDTTRKQGHQSNLAVENGAPRDQSESAYFSQHQEYSEPYAEASSRRKNTGD